MPKIINNLPPESYVKLDRELLRDKRLSAESKLLYGVFVALARSCENVFPSYRWLASEIGYEYESRDENYDEAKAEKATGAYIAKYVEELVRLNMVIKIVNPGKACDYQINNYNPPLKSGDTPHEKVGGNPPLKSRGSIKSISIKNEEEEEQPQPQPPQKEIKKEYERFDYSHVDYLLEQIPELNGYPALGQIVESLKRRENYKEFVLYVKLNKKGKNKDGTPKVFDTRGWTKYFYEDYEQKTWLKTEYKNEPESKDGDMSDAEYIEFMIKQGLEEYI
jgi:hypothetical protein